ncbi:hypothetical protein ACIRVF_32200 [Kitasatospora sp. NPDC101157]|uniref:hypothetical protein n=1 Tax=Kitasatospora sp. NPDC101157 TaxID=3364098 RepID=UPI003805DF34
MTSRPPPAAGHGHADAPRRPRPGRPLTRPLPPHSLYAAYLDRWVLRAAPDRLNGVDDTHHDHR